MKTRVLEIIQVATGVAAIVALTLALIGINNLNVARQDARRDSCYLLRGLVYAATTKAPKQRAAAHAYIERTALRDCNHYAKEH